MVPGTLFTLKLIGRYGVLYLGSPRQGSNLELWVAALGRNLNPKSSIPWRAFAPGASPLSLPDESPPLQRRALDVLV